MNFITLFTNDHISKQYVNVILIKTGRSQDIKSNKIGHAYMELYGQNYVRQNDVRADPEKRTYPNSL